MEGENSNTFRESLLRTLKPINEINSRLRNNEIDFQHKENFISYKNTEIRKLESNTKILDLASSAMEKRSKLVDQTLNELDFSLDVSQKCSEEKISLQIMLQAKIDDCKENIKHAEADFKKKYNGYLEEYNEVLGMYECYHPLFNQVKKLKIESLKLEVELKMINKSISDANEQRATRKEITKMITQANIIKFVASISELQKSKNLQAELEEAQKCEEELVKELGLLELKQKQKAASQLKAPSEMPYLEFHQPRMIEDIITSRKANASKVSFSIGDSRLNCDNWISGINNRIYQRQQQWLQHRSILDDKLIPQKRPAIENGTETRPPPTKQKKLGPIIKAHQNIVLSKAENKQRVQIQTPVAVEKSNPTEKTIQIENEVAEPQISGYFNKKSFDTAVSSAEKKDMVTSSPVYSFNDSIAQHNHQEELSYNAEDVQSSSGLMDCSLNISMEMDAGDEGSVLQIGNSEPENNPFSFNFNSNFQSGNEGGSVLSRFF